MFDKQNRKAAQQCDRGSLRRCLGCGGRVGNGNGKCATAPDFGVNRNGIIQNLANSLYNGETKSRALGGLSLGNTEIFIEDALQRLFGDTGAAVFYFKPDVAINF